MKAAWCALVIVLLTTSQAPELPSLAIKVDVSLVNVAFLVRDASGALNRGLTNDDFEVFEDGVKQEIQFFNRSADIPLRLGLVVDASDSQDKFNKQHRADGGRSPEAWAARERLKMAV